MLRPSSTCVPASIWRQLATSRAALWLLDHNEPQLPRHP
jgi:hypothetical protein